MFLLAVTLCAVPSCKMTRRADESADASEAGNVRDQVRAGVTERMRGPSPPTRCFADRPEYCIDVDTLLDPIIQGVVDREFGGVWPSEGRDVRRLIRTARRVYRDAAASPEAMARIESKVKERFENPIITVEGGKARADHGHVPGTLHSYPRWGVRLKESSLGDGGRPAGAEIGRLLRALAAAHPGEATYEVVVLIHKGTVGRPKTWTYRYTPRSGRIRVDDGDRSSWWAGRAASLEALGGAVSLRTRDLASCSNRVRDGDLREICRDD